jgi:hypothetical protein
VGLNIPLDLVSVGAKQIDRNLQVPGFVHLDEPVQSYPAQHLRMGVVEAAGAPLPDPLVRLAPPPAHRTTETVEHPTRVAVEAPAAA